jgi:hypothetical protein
MPRVPHHFGMVDSSNFAGEQMCLLQSLGYSQDTCPMNFDCSSLPGSFATFACDVAVRSASGHREECVVGQHEDQELLGAASAFGCVETELSQGCLSRR